MAWGRSIVTAALRERVHHGHVDIEVVGLFETLAAQRAGKVQVGLGLVLGHVVLEGGPLAALEPTNLTPVKRKLKGGLDGQTADAKGTVCLVRGCVCAHTHTHPLTMEKEMCPKFAI